MKTSGQEVILTGIPAAPGFASGEAYVLGQEELEFPRFQHSDPDAERARLDHARGQAIGDLDQIQRHAASQVGEAQAAILEAHKMFLDDFELMEMVSSAIEDGANAEAAWMDSIEKFASELALLPDPTLSERAADVRDVGRRVLRLLLGKKDRMPTSFDRPVVIVAQDLEPSQTAQFSREMILAFCTAAGGPTSHTAILAKALGIPAVVGVGKELLDLASGTPLLVNGGAGLVTANPETASLAAFETLSRRSKDLAVVELINASLPAITSDQHTVEVVANVGSLADAQAAILNGAEGIGLLRTEFLYLDRSVEPSENEQYRAYRDIMDIMGSRPVVVRTLDAGGDKQMAYLNVDAEANPFLGLRAIRLCLQKPDMFLSQLRALLRAGEGSDLRIMFPMIATLDEFRQAKKFLARAREELAEARLPHHQNPQVGIMVEIPSVVWMVEEFAREVDFFSIGTNDLTQYTFAAERTNQRVAYLADACHPAILRQVRQVVETAHRHGCWVGVCGEMAGDPDAVPLLLGLGVDELSMAPASIPHAKTLLRAWSYSEAQLLAQNSLNLEAAGLVRETIPDKGSNYASA